MTTVIGALIVGIIGMFAVVLSQGIYAGQSTAGWASILVTATSNIPAIIAIVAILAMLIGVAKLAGSIGASGVGAMGL